MHLLARAFNLGFDIVDALPRRPVPALLVVLLVAVVVTWPGLLLEIGRLRAQPVIDAVTEAVGGRTGRG